MITANELRTVVTNVPIPPDVEGVRAHRVVIAAGWASSVTQANRLFRQQAVHVLDNPGLRSGGRPIDVDGMLRQSDLKCDGMLVLRKGTDLAIGIPTGGNA